MGRRSKQTFFQRHTDGQQACEKMVNITIREVQIKATMRENASSASTQLWSLNIKFSGSLR